MLRAAIRLPVSILLLSATVAALSQELKLPDTPELLHIAPQPSDRFPAKWYPRTGDGTDIVPAPVLDRPYTATVETIENDETAKTLRRVASGFQARDRSGRTRTESENGAMGVGDTMEKTKAVTVYDPVSHCQFEWTQLMSDTEMPPEYRLAIVTCGPQTLRYKEMDFYRILMDTTPDGTTTHGDTTTTVEHLMPLPMNGLSIERLRVTNSRLDERGQVKKSSAETWYSPELKEIVREGEELTGYSGLIEIQRKDPDPKLFYPPEGYRIEMKQSR